MNTKQAEYESALDRLRADMAKRDHDMRADMAKRDHESAKREMRIIYAVLATGAFGVAILGLLMQFS